MLPAPLPDFRPPDPCCYSPPRVARLPLRPLTALYASWYGLTLQKPNVSGPPYGFTARRHMVLLHCRASSSFHAFLPRRLVPPSPGDGGSQTKAGPRQNIISWSLRYLCYCSTPSGKCSFLWGAI